MPTSSRRPLLVLLACAVLALAACGSDGGGATPAEASGSLRVLDATVDAPANPKVAAMRLVVDNGTATDDLLVGASSPDAESVTIHRSVVDSAGRAVMVEAPAVPIAARSTVRFDPGGLHVMLTGLRRTLEVGDTVPVTLRFRHAGAVRVRAEARARSSFSISSWLTRRKLPYESSTLSEKFA